MRSCIYTAVVGATVASALTLKDICTVDNIEAALPSNGTLLGIDVIPSLTTAAIVVNGTSNSQGGSGAESYTYCNATVTYTHTGKGDSVVVRYAFPSPAAYQNRFYVAGGGGYSLSTSSLGGFAYGAAGGVTDGGYSALDGTAYDSVALAGNGSINWDNTYMFAYQALGEMVKLGKYITPLVYNGDSTRSNSTKLYTYFEGCSDGGREGMSQVQRFGDQYDGVISGAPAFRFAQQQIHHIYPAVVETVQEHLPPPCALQKIVNATIAACDPLDGRTDGVVSRTDLCKLNFNLTSVIGESYYCAASTSSSLGFGFSKRQAPAGGMTGGGPGSSTSSSPAQNGTVTAEDVAVAQAIYEGLHNSDGKRAYLSWQIGAALSDAEPTYDNNTASWKVNIPSTGGEFVEKFVKLVDADNLTDLEDVDYDTVVEWMNIAYYRYLDSLQNTVVDLTEFQESGGKLLHYHGESDPSIPSPASIKYWQSVLDAMYPDSDFDNATAEMSDWYQFYLIPGAAHCGVNSLQPGVYPKNNMDTLINWVENGVKPQRLNATATSGTLKGESQLLCQWPERPIWSGNSTTFDCEFDQDSYDSWTYTFDAFKTPVY